MNTISKYSLFILITLVHCSYSTKGQSTEKDSIEFFKLIDSANVYLDNDFSTAELIAHKAFEFANSRSYRLGLGQGAYTLSRIFYQKSEFSKADSLLNYSISIFLNPKNEEYLSMCYLLKGNINISYFELDSAEHYLNKSIQLDNKTNDKEGLGYNYHNLGTVQDYRGEYESALIYFQKGIKIFEEFENNEMASNAYNNIAIIYYHLKRYNDAIGALQEAINLNKAINNRYNLTLNYVTLAAQYIQIDSLQSAEYYSILALEQSNDLNFIRGKLFSLAALGDLELKRNEPKKALSYFNKFNTIFPSEGDAYMKAEINSKLGLANRLLGNNKMAIQYFKEALISFEEFNTLQNMMDTHQQLSEVYALEKSYKLAHTHLVLRDSLKQENFDSEMQKQIREIEAEYETDKQEAINNQLKAEKNLSDAQLIVQRNYLLGTGIGVGVFSILSILLFLQSKKRKKLNSMLSEQKDRIDILNQELNHRVKNNLTFMTSLLEMQGRRTDTKETKQILKESENRLKALSIVHSNLFHSESEAEINLNQYLSEISTHLEEIFNTPGKHLKINQSFINFNINAEDAMRIGLIVNELITNSVKHAFGEVENPIIKIRTYISNENKLVLEYLDNGPGLEKEVLPDQTNTSLGTKLIELLKAQLEDQYVFSIS